jgi:hypothetical protein
VGEPNVRVDGPSALYIEKAEFRTLDDSWHRIIGQHLSAIVEERVGGEKPTARWAVKQTPVLHSSDNNTIDHGLPSPLIRAEHLGNAFLGSLSKALSIRLVTPIESSSSLSSFPPLSIVGVYVAPGKRLDSLSAISIVPQRDQKCGDAPANVLDVIVPPLKIERKNGKETPCKKRIRTLLNSP